VRKVAPALDSDPIMYVGRVRYAIGKRTDLYALAAYAKAKHNQLVSLSRDDAGFDSNQKNVSVGIQVRF
jgi:predicted porin